MRDTDRSTRRTDARTDGGAATRDRTDGGRTLVRRTDGREVSA